MDQCIGEVQQAGGEKMSRAEAQRVLDMVDARSARLQREQGMAPADAVRQAHADLAAAEEAAAAIERHNALLNLQKRIGRRERMGEVATALGGRKGPDLVAAVRNQVVAINRVVQGGRASAERMWKTRESEYVGGVESDLKKAGVLGVFQKGTLRREWATELYQRSLRDAGLPHQLGSTGSAEAGRIADVLAKYQALAKDRLNRQGAWIGDYAGYITATAHDPDRIRRAGFAAWRDHILPGLDERTFDGVEDRAKMLRGTWNALVSGVHLSDEGGVGFKDPAFTGPSNLARRLSESRVLHFKDAASWLDYQQRFGTGTLEEQFLGALQRSARQEALLTRWGTNPAAEFETDIRFLQEKFRDSNPDAVRALGDRAASLKALFGVLDGSANRPVNQLGAEIGAGLRAISSMAHLGGVALTHLSAMGTKASELRYQGVGFLERYGNFFTSVFHGLQGPEREELADLMRAGVEVSHGGMMAQIASTDTVPGAMAKTANRFFDLTGLNYLLRGQKNGAAGVIARQLGRLADTEFDALPAQTRRAFTQYDISPADWDTLRSAPDHHMIDGRVFLTPDAAMRAAGEISLDARDALGLKLHAYLTDVADRSVVTPGIAERALLQGGTAPGTAAGEALRFVAQFKTWGVAAVRQGIGREIQGGQGTAGAISGIVQMAVSAMVMGYATMVLKDLAKGLNPRPPGWQTYTAALMQGGGFGILGDFLFGQFNRFGGDIGSTVLGPVLGEGLNSIAQIYSNVLDGQMKDIPPETLRLAMNNTPFVNLFYTRTALNYLFLHSLQERMNPGYLRRSERSLRQKTGQSYWLSPQSHLHTFGR